ncbi:MAG: nucleotidyltransferase domain-containing protein [Bacteroidales bacterium]|nr:nucleotidyltransferase domain-containing protein [Bacteroidales bacterium]
MELQQIQDKKDKINKACKKYHVSLLYIFGSVLTKKFNKDSDIDFIVYFEQIPILDYADNFFDFIIELEKILNRKVDLVSGKAMKNPYFIEEVEKTKQLVYGNRN